MLLETVPGPGEKFAAMEVDAGGLVTHDCSAARISARSVSLHEDPYPAEQRNVPSGNNGAM
jgi:hypothetical protein